MDQRLVDIVQLLKKWLYANVLTTESAIQWTGVAVSLLLAFILWRMARGHLSRWIEGRISSELVRSVLSVLMGVGSSAILILMLQICSAVLGNMDIQPRVLDAASHLAVAWIVIRILTCMMANHVLARIVATIIWGGAALAIFGLLTPITDFLTSLSYSVGETKFTAYGAIKGLILAAIFLQLASMSAEFVSRRVRKVKDLSPSLQVLTIKAVKTVLFAVAILFSMSSVGIDLTSLAIFSSAIGVGIGFGLKTIFSNYVAGIILLMDNSIKPGDTIEVGGVYGVVRGMHGRYASVLTRDGKEYLIPNELLISGEVVNWTFSDRNIRLSLPVGIAYGSDVEEAMGLLLKAPENVTRVLKNPNPVAFLVGFGDSSVDLELRIWIADAEQGLTNVRSEVYLNIWRLFKEHGVQIPFPQRDVLLKQNSSLSVKIDKETTEGDR